GRGASGRREPDLRWRVGRGRVVAPEQRGAPTTQDTVGPGARQGGGPQREVVDLVLAAVHAVPDPAIPPAIARVGDRGGELRRRHRPRRQPDGACGAREAGGAGVVSRRKLPGPDLGAGLEAGGDSGRRGWVHAAHSAGGPPRRRPGT